MEENLGLIFSAKEEYTIRKHDETESKTRNKFDRDRDRILYSRAFRRLSGKTQVFISGNDDHIRNRLSHTLEVSQISRSIAKTLKLNETLAEAIALGHDIGHTPFGHVGERTLNYIMNGCDELRDFKNCLGDNKGFKHNWQSIRVITELEDCRPDFNGLNLTSYTLWGILHHSKLKYKECTYHYNDSGIIKCSLRRNDEICKNPQNNFSLGFYDKYSNYIRKEDITIEGLIVAIADEIAQRHHDVDDALLAKIIDFDELLNKINDCYKEFYQDDDKEKFESLHNTYEPDLKRMMLSSFIVDVITTNTIKVLRANLNNLRNKYNIRYFEDFERLKHDESFITELIDNIKFEEVFERKDKEFQKFIRNRILNSHKAQCMDGKGNYILRELFKAYITNPQQLPDKTVIRLFKNLEKHTVGNYIKNESVHETVGLLRDALQELHQKNDNNYKEALMRTICDYISGMTDKYALELYSTLYENVRL